MSNQIPEESAEISIDVPLRQRFLELIATNPNYFGNFNNSEFKAIQTISHDTFYEQLTCLGFNPDTQRLEAVVQVKQPTGYNGSLCQAGSYEYVRFFVDFGSGFEDAGVVAANVHDLPNAEDCHGTPEKPLSYAVSVQLGTIGTRCTSPELPQVRAILSWNAIPTAGDPSYSPVWGNVLEARIQIKPRAILIKDVVGTLSEEAALLVSPEKLEEVLKLPIPLPDPPPLTLGELKTLYGSQSGASKGSTMQASQALAVPAHRFGFAQVNAALQASTADSQKVAQNIAAWQAVGLNWQQVVSQIIKTQADVSYEQLECLGLEGAYGLERLTANLVIKRPTGYNGGLCTAGSEEYVAFWADWENTCRFTYLGTVAVRVHDIPGIPAGGLVYSASLPVDLSAYRQLCDTPRIARVRAVLSWSAPPSTTNPDALSTWGNLIDAHVQIQPGTIADPLRPKLSILGGIPTSMIDSSSGQTTPNAVFALTNTAADSENRPCPFGGRVAMQGDLFPGYKYQITVQPASGGPVTALNTPLMLTRWDGTTYMSSPDPANFYTYMDPDQNIDSLLGEWDTTGDDKWRITLLIADSSDHPVPGSLPDIHVMQLDNTPPQAAVHLDSSGDCGRFTVGAVLNGHFVAYDANFGSFNLYSEPFAGPVTPGSGFTPTAALPSSGSSWTLNTGGLQPCGYVVELDVADRSIVNSSPGNHNFANASVGFCLLQTA